MKPTTTSYTDRFFQQNRWNSKSPAPRRTGHGGMAWVNETCLRQPQDGALESLESIVVEEIPSPRVRGSFARLNEPEDAGLTGATRSLGRRLLGLNMVGALPVALHEPLQPKRATVLFARTQVA
jgi:hypothetical protein